MDKKVKTIKSEIVSKSLCRKIEGEYYKVGNRNIKDSGDCYKINGRYYKDNTGYIVFDHFNNKYEIYNSEKFIKGVVDIKNEKLIIGYFLKNDLMHFIEEKNFTRHNLMSYSLIDEKFYKLDRYNNIFRHKDNISILDSLNFKSINNDYKRSLNYNINKDIIIQCENLYFDYKDKLPTYEISKPLSQYLNGLSFGLEFETTKGVIPKKYCYANGLVPLRDGSIEGLEYVTLPLQEKEGIDSIINITKLLNNYTTFDNSCSLHMHIGNIPRTESFILALFKVLCNVEKDFYKMFPLYKQINGGFKKKNYTSPLPAVKLLSKMDSKITKDNISDNFSILFEYLSNGIEYREYNKSLSNVYSHPYDPDNNRKWNVASRYHWVNMIPLIFGNKETIEFRIHTPAKDPNKILMFLLLISKLINFVKNNEKDILNNKFNDLSLKYIINSLDSNLQFERKLNYYIYNYIISRTNFTKSKFKKKDFNYDEKDYDYNVSRNLNFLDNSGTSFLFNKEKNNSSLELFKKTYNEFMEASNRNAFQVEMQENVQTTQGVLESNDEF